MAEKYDHKKIEKKWQKRWEESGAFKTDTSSSKPKYYVLDMFPYPSGAGLHVGHVEGYTATDIYSRYKRAKGYAVLHPMGWDAFGLPAENYAIKTGTPPRTTTDESIDNFRKQIKNLGLSYDWEREVGTHNPDYYKWTQWLFTKFFEKGLVYKKKALVNWDPVDQTVLANEQVLPDGTAERSGAKVEKKDLEQWFFKITDYADELIEGLEKLDWPESTKINQRNWIGRSAGAEIEFSVAQSDKKIKVFTTRPDTLFGATYLVLAPEHPLVQELLEKSSNKEEVVRYIEQTRTKTEIERTAEGKEKTGVELKGIQAINPANKEKIPVYIADYVLAGYGTGAIMAVPAHDKRDWDFATSLIPRITGESSTKYIKHVIEPKSYRDLIPHHGMFYEISNRTIENAKEEEAKNDLVLLKQDRFCYPGEGILVNSETYNGLDSIDAKKKITGEIGGELKKTYRLRDWLISRQRYWGAPIPIVYDPEGKAHAIPEEHLPWKLPEDVEYLPKGTSPLGSSKELFERTEQIFGKGWKPEIDTMDTFACSSWYFLRFADPHNEREFASADALKRWLPVDLYVGGAEHTVLHLLYARFFTKALRDMKYLNFDEPFLTLRHPGIILAEDSRKMSKRWDNVINPDDVVEMFGADSVRVYEMFMGPLHAMKPWNTNNIMGARRFLERVWVLAAKVGSGEINAQTESLRNATIEKVSNDIETLKLNTAVSALMIYANHLAELESIPKAAYSTLLKLLYPFAPHITSEIASNAGYADGAITSDWPAYDKSKILNTSVMVAVQINGKTRTSIELSPSTTEEEALKKAKEVPEVAKWLGKGVVTKAIYVPGRIINFVVNKG